MSVSVCCCAFVLGFVCILLCVSVYVSLIASRCVSLCICWSFSVIACFLNASDCFHVFALAFVCF